MASPARRLTFDDFENLPDEQADYKELVDGELVDVSGNNGGHNKLKAELLFRLILFAKQKNLGLAITEQEFAFGSNAHGPDIALIATAKMGLFDEKKRIQRYVPDFAIEIVSPNDRWRTLMDKVLRYREYGTSEVWIFDHEAKRALVFSQNRETVLGEADDFAPEQLPGLVIPLRELFNL